MIGWLLRILFGERITTRLLGRSPVCVFRDWGYTDFFPTACSAYSHFECVSGYCRSHCKKICRCSVGEP